MCVLAGMGAVGFPFPFFVRMCGWVFFVYVLFGFVTGVTSMPCPMRMVGVGYHYMDSGSVSQNVRLISHEFPENS